MTLYNEEDRKVLESLQKSVTKALDRKRRLGQYAVVWKDGKPFYIGSNPPTEQSKALVTSKTVENNTQGQH
ncbi:hypothetical protein H0A66_07010 [Alcaligenaceae bacterium]|nr:hypothetical protein [Alcaligenaceae bacterium]